MTFKITIIIFVILSLFPGQRISAQEELVKLDFESRDLSTWKAIHLFKPVKFEVSEENGNHFLRASCGEDSETSFQYFVNLPIKKGTKVRWRWRMIEAKHHIPESKFSQWGNFPARLYLFFEPYPENTYCPALAYIWTIALATKKWDRSLNPAPHRYLTIESGFNRKGQWIEVERDIYQDFVEALGQEPPRLTAIAVLLGVPGKKGSATFDYDDIEIIGPGTKNSSTEGKNNGEILVSVLRD